MGIDIYLRWNGQAEEAKQAQFTGFDATKGSVGYLRESYAGEPYVTRHLFPEAFSAPDGEAQIPASVLRSRLPRALVLSSQREDALYPKDSAEMRAKISGSFVDFVSLAEKKEKETGEPCTISASY